jgi:hypothetical protein
MGYPQVNQWVALPNPVVHLDTQGRPVPILFAVTVDMGSNSSIQLCPSIDGQIPTPSIADEVLTFNAASAGTRTTLNFARVYDLPKGAHVFGVLMACPAGGQVIVEIPRWLTVYELR